MNIHSSHTNQVKFKVNATHAIQRLYIIQTSRKLRIYLHHAQLLPPFHSFPLLRRRNKLLPDDFLSRPDLGANLDTGYEARHDEEGLEGGFGGLGIGEGVWCGKRLFAVEDLGADVF